jgi:hypothetical protein
MPPAPTHTRRRLQFSLRTMLLAFTLFAVWLGWELSVIRERKAFLKRVRYSGPANLVLNPRPHSDLPVYRRWLGDATVERIDAENEADAKVAEKLFPELRELFFVDTDNYIKDFYGDRIVPEQMPSGK